MSTWEDWDVIAGSVSINYKDETPVESKWISIYKEVPEDGALVTSRIAGQEAYVGCCTYDAKTATFRTYYDHSNRLEIIIWKHNEWKYFEGH